MHADLLTLQIMIMESSDSILSSADLSDIGQRHFHPTAQIAGTHCRSCTVKHPQKRTALFLLAHRFAKLQITARIDIHFHILTAEVDLQGTDIGNIGLLCLGDIVKQSADRCRHRMTGMRIGDPVRIAAELRRHARPGSLLVKAIRLAVLDHRMQTLAEIGTECGAGGAADIEQDLTRRIGT